MLFRTSSELEILDDNEQHADRCKCEADKEQYICHKKGRRDGHLTLESEMYRCEGCRYNECYDLRQWIEDSSNMFRISHG